MTRTRPALEDFPFTVEIPARYNDVDANHHLNNVALAGFYEEARASFHRHALGEVLVRRPRSWRLFVAHLTIDYFGEAHYPGRYVVGQGMLRFGRSSFAELGALFRLDGGTCLGACETTMVYAAEVGPAPIPEEFRAQLRPHAVRGHELG